MGGPPARGGTRSEPRRADGTRRGPPTRRARHGHRVDRSALRVPGGVGGVVAAPGSPAVRRRVRHGPDRAGASGDRRPRARGRLPHLRGARRGPQLERSAGLRPNRRSGRVAAPTDGRRPVLPSQRARVPGRPHVGHTGAGQRPPRRRGARRPGGARPVPGPPRPEAAHPRRGGRRDPGPLRRQSGPGPAGGRSAVGCRRRSVGHLRAPRPRRADPRALPRRVAIRDPPGQPPAPSRSIPRSLGAKAVTGDSREPRVVGPGHGVRGDDPRRHG